MSVQIAMIAAALSMLESSATALFIFSQQITQMSASFFASGVGTRTSYRNINCAASSIRSRMSSILLISWWMSSRSIGVMKVLCSSSIVLRVIRSARFSMDSML